MIIVLIFFFPYILDIDIDHVQDHVDTSPDHEVQAEERRSRGDRKERDQRKIVNKILLSTPFFVGI